MHNRSKSKSGKDLAEARTFRYALLLIWGIFGIIGALCLLYGEYQLRLARVSMGWPVVAGRIVTSEVTADTDAEGTTYSDEIEYVYTVDGTEHQADVIMFGGHEYGPHQVVRYYPLGAEVSVAYDPVKPSRSVLEPGTASYWWRRMGISTLLVVLFIATAFNFILRRASSEEKSLLDHTLIGLFKAIYKTFYFPLKMIFFPLKMNLWVLGGMIGLAVLLAVLDFNPTLTLGSTLVAALYGIPWAIISWITLMDWLSNMDGDGGVTKSESRKVESQKADDRLIQKVLGYFEGEIPKKESNVEGEAKPDTGTNVKTTRPLIAEGEKAEWEKPFCWKCMNHTEYKKGYYKNKDNIGPSAEKHKECTICGSKGLNTPAGFDYYYRFGMHPRAFPISMGCLYLLPLLFIFPCMVILMKDGVMQNQIWGSIFVIGFFVALYGGSFLWMKFKYGAWKKWAKLRGWKEPSRSERIKRGAAAKNNPSSM